MEKELTINPTQKMSKKKYYILLKPLPWFEKGVVLELHGSLEDNTGQWHRYKEYAMEDIPQRELLDFFLKNYPDWFQEVNL